MFWYGQSFDQVGTTPLAAINALVKRLPRRQAELKIMLFEAMRASQLSTEDAQAALNRWLEALGPQQASAATPLASPHMLTLLHIGVVHVAGEPGRGGSGPRRQ